MEIFCKCSEQTFVSNKIINKVNTPGARSHFKSNLFIKLARKMLQNERSDADAARGVIKCAPNAFDRRRYA